MSFLKSKDPAPSRLFYKINRLFYKLWFKTLLVAVFLISGAFLAKKMLYKNRVEFAFFSRLLERLWPANLR